MSTAQKAKYEKLKEAYGTDGSTLKEAVNPTVTVTVADGAEYQNDFIVANNRSYSYVSDEYANGNERVNIPSATVCRRVRSISLLSRASWTAR